VGRLSASLVAFALLATAALALSACGGGGEDAKLLPGTTASQINSNLDQVRSLVSEEDCIGAENAAASVSEEIDALEGVDAKLKQALREGAERLSVVVGECEETAALEGEESEALETAEEAEREEEQEPKGNRQPKHKPEKEVEEGVPNENEEGPTLPPSSNGKGEEQGNGEGPPAEPGGAGSGGIGPGTPAGEG
jgi:hypothetical protein